MYTSLNDANYEVLPGLAKGNVKVWYVKPEYFRHFGFGLKDAASNGYFINPNDLSKTHILLGEISSSFTMEEMYSSLQGEVWSPRGEAHDLIQRLGLSHTSMSVGDIFETDRDGYQVYVVDNFGFTPLCKTEV